MSNLYHYVNDKSFGVAADAVKPSLFTLTAMPKSMNIHNFDTKVSRSMRYVLKKQCCKSFNEASQVNLFMVAIHKGLYQISDHDKK